MMVIRHRINQITDLQELECSEPVEVDIHGFGDRLVVHHDAMQDGVNFEDWLEAAGRRFAILNVKEEGIEERVLDMAEKSQLADFFLLDLSFPSLIKQTRKNEKRVAIRVSEYEHYSAALKLNGKINWIWLDCFHGFPLNETEIIGLTAVSSKICLVSPELHGPERTVDEVVHFQSMLKKYQFKVDAVCTKLPELWLNASHSYQRKTQC